MKLTNELLKEMLLTLEPNDISSEMERHQEWILVELSIVNNKPFASIASLHFEETIMDEAKENGDLFLWKPVFRIILESMNIKF